MLAFVGGAVSGTATETFEMNLDDDGVISSEDEIVADRTNITVIATDSNSWRGETSDGPRARAELVAFRSNGSILYYNDSHTRYWDVDQVPGTRATVEYMFADHLESETCSTEVNHSRRRVNSSIWQEYAQARSSDACTMNGYERVNLTTGEVTTLWNESTPGKEATRYHDADRLNETHIAVADIYLDRVFIVNLSRDQTTWTWNASSAYTEDSGGPYPEDWTHINDIETLDDGRLMVSLRNQDQVAFLNRSRDTPDQTLGEENQYETLYEQHNPDYISPAEGGPAVVVADSENNRVVEYRETGDGWEQSWVWQDARMQWPRDADRLPNGHTLITDSNGNRVFEVAENGSIVWTVNIAFPYEAERLNTGDESTGGPAATESNLESSTAGISDQVIIVLKQFLPSKYLNGFMYITPVWVGFLEALEIVVISITVVIWGCSELIWYQSNRVISNMIEGGKPW